MILTEVNLFITDIIMATVAGIAYAKLNTTRNTIAYFYQLFLLFTGCAAIVAGFGHLLSHYTGNYLKSLGWSFSIAANGSLGLACLRLIDKPKWRYILYAKSILLLVLVLVTMQFKWIVFDTVFTMLVLTIPTHVATEGNKKTGGWIVASISFTMLTGVVTYFNITLSPVWMTAKDINHLIIAIGLWMIYLGAKKLEQLT